MRLNLVDAILYLFLIGVSGCSFAAFFVTFGDSEVMAPHAVIVALIMLLSGYVFAGAAAWTFASAWPDHLATEPSAIFSNHTRAETLEPLPDNVTVVDFNNAG